MYVGSGPDHLYGSFPLLTGRVDFQIPHSGGGSQKYQHALFEKSVLAREGLVGPGQCMFQ